MKAIRVHQFGGPETLSLDDVTVPLPQPGQVLIRTRAAGVNPVDTYIRSGTYTFQPPLPYTPGIDAAGDVEAVGQGVTRVQPGDRVYCAGCLTGAAAEYILAADFQTFLLPEKLSYAQGAGIGIPYGTAHRALFDRGHAKPGEWLLVHGASGAVGLAALQIAAGAGLNVIGTAGADKGLDLVRDHGAALALNHHDTGHLAASHEATGGKGLDLILEMLANINLGDDLPHLAPNGRVVVIGSRGPVEIDARHLMTRDADIRGMSLLNITNEDRDRIHAELRKGFDTGALAPTIAREYPLAEAQQAHHDVINASTHGKLVLIP